MVVGKFPHLILRLIVYCSCHTCVCWASGHHANLTMLIDQSSIDLGYYFGEGAKLLAQFPACAVTILISFPMLVGVANNDMKWVNQNLCHMFISDICWVSTSVWLSVNMHVFIAEHRSKIWLSVCCEHAVCRTLPAEVLGPVTIHVRWGTRNGDQWFMLNGTWRLITVLSPCWICVTSVLAVTISPAGLATG